MKRKERKEIDAKHKALLEAVDKVFKDTKAERDKMRHGRKLYEAGVWSEDSELFPDRGNGDGKNIAQYNTIFAVIRQIAPMVTANRPISKVAPKFAYMWKMGETLNHILKYAWDALDFQMKLYRGVIDTMTSNLAVFKLGYNLETNELELSLIDPVDFFIAPGYETIWDAPWSGVKAQKPLSWVRRNFSHIKEVTPDEVQDEDKSRAYKFGDTSGPSEDMQFATVYEVWMKDEEALKEIIETDENGEETKVETQEFPYGKLCFFTKEEWLDEIACEDDHGKPPYVEMFDYVRPHNFVGMSEVDQIEGLHKEINVLIKYVCEYTRLNHAPNFLADISRLEDDTVEALKDRLALGNQIIPWSSQGENDTPPIQQITQGQLNPQIQMLLLFLIDLVDIVSGVTDVSRGQVGKQERQSASEVAMLKEASDIPTMQRTRNLEWTVGRIDYILLRLMMQHSIEPKEMSYEQSGDRVYSTYGNSFAQADEIMQPTKLNAGAQEALDTGKPMAGANKKEKARYDQEVADYEKFLSVFKKGDDAKKQYDPVYFGFDVEIQSDSTLPTDKQSRANQYLRLRTMKSIDVMSLLERLQIPNPQQIVERLQKEMGGGKDEKALMAANPEAAAKYKQEQGAKQ